MNCTLHTDTDSSAAPELALWQQLRQTPQLLEEIAGETGNELHLQNRLRKNYPAELVRLGLELSTARRKAPAKFSRGAELWLTRQSYEQATAEPLARYKAERFSRYAGQGIVIHDFCTGLGADAIALAEHTPVVSCDTDPVMQQLAQWNAELYGQADRIDFQATDASQVNAQDLVIHIDPDQRDAAGRRHLRLEQIQPGLTVLQQMAVHCRGGAIKLSPASNFGGKFPDCEIELVSWQGECKLAIVWCGELGESGLWRATVLPAKETLAGDPLSAWPEFSEVQDYVHDPDPAVVRAGLINLLAEKLAVHRLDDADEYLTSPEQLTSPFVTSFRVRDVLNRNEKELRKYLRQHKIGTVEIKCRQVPVDVEKLRKSLPLQGPELATLIYARVAGKTRILVCERP